MIKYCSFNLREIHSLVLQLKDEQYARKISWLSDASIGQHVRHILEFYDCLFGSLQSGMVNYDNRRRSQKIEMETMAARNSINKLLNTMKPLKADRPLILIAKFDPLEQFTQINSSLYRELAYNLEHGIHHQALIKVGLQELGLSHLVSADFGVAPATRRHIKDSVLRPTPSQSHA